MSKLITERFGFREVCESNWSDDTVVYLFYGIDRPLYNTQTGMVMEELEADTEKLFKKPRSKAAVLRKKWWRHFDSLDHDGYGSLRLQFDSAIMALKDADLEAITEDIHCLINDTDFMQDMCIWMGVEGNGIQEYMDGDDDLESVYDMYVDSLLKCGYRVEQAELEDLFCEYEPKLDKDFVAQDLLMRHLKGENVRLRAVDVSPHPFFNEFGELKQAA
jgi:hypothetical protein